MPCFTFPLQKKKNRKEIKDNNDWAGASVCLNLPSAPDFVVVFSREYLVYHHDQGPAHSVIVNIV